MVELGIFSLSYFMFVLLQFGFDHTVRFDVIMTLACFENVSQKYGCLFQFESNQFYLVAIRPNSLKNTKFWQSSFIYTLRRSVSLLTSASNFQTLVACTRQTVFSRYFCLSCNVLWAIC